MNSLKRLKLISAVYDYMAHAPSHLEQDIDTNCNREMPIAWDMYQIVAAIAGDYRIELSPHYKGVQRLRRNERIVESSFTVRCFEKWSRVPASRCGRIQETAGGK